MVVRGFLSQDLGSIISTNILQESRPQTILTLSGLDCSREFGALVALDVFFKVFQHDELPTLLALLRPTTAVVLVVLQAAGLHVCGAPPAEHASL